MLSFLHWAAYKSGAKAVKKVWGSEYWIVNSENYCLKLLEIHPGFQCSLHKHLIKDETFIVLDGVVKLEQADVRGTIFEETLRSGDQRRIAPKTPHRFGSMNGAMILEISTHHEDTDVVRIAESGPIQA